MGTYKGFSKVQLKAPQRSKFDLSHEKKLSTRMGKLVPVFFTETLPNDTFRVNTEVLLRFAPLISPIYHRVNVFVHFFFVPMRLLYKDWEKFITNGRLGTETAPIPPRISVDLLLNQFDDLMDVGSLSDYLGWNPVEDNQAGAWPNRYVSALPYAACYKAWYDYYRDRNFVDDNEMLPLPSGTITAAEVAGGDFTTLCGLKTRAWQHDYFTSALPWTQRGDEVLMPMEMDITYRPSALLRHGGISVPSAANLNLQTSIVSSDPSARETKFSDGLQASIDNIETIENGSVSINDLRTAVVLQQWLERNAVAGSRYNEQIMAHFNRKTSDGRLQRAEYLGGGRVPVQISEVMTTAFSGIEEVPPANPAGKGMTYANKNSFRYNCEEHGFVVGFMSVMPTTAYMQGIPRYFAQRNTFLDYPWPSFANLGEQPVYTYEVYGINTLYPTAAIPEGPIFGYQSRYADWKWLPSTTHGDFRTSLDHWHLDRKFSGIPSLGEQFVTFDDALQDRIFAVAEVDTLWCYIHNNASVIRSLPYFGTPRL